MLTLFRVHHVLRRVCRRHFTVLGIETSADDTCAAIVSSNGTIHSNVVIKQHHIHEQYGGIDPLSAIHAHQRNMPFAIRRALSEARMDLGTHVDGVAFTRGPGMPGCLGVGMDAAKALAAAHDKPLVGVHHMQAHALTPLLPSLSPTPPTFPFLTLLISGGHTLLLLASSPTSFRTLASTADEAVGRAFDKVARMLGLGWGEMGPGHALERFVAGGDEGGEGVEVKRMTPPLPGKLAFSFSAPHSQAQAMLSAYGSHDTPIPLNVERAIAQEFQRAAVEQLCDKVVLGLRTCVSEEEGVRVKDVVVSGGVASNMYLRARLREALDEYSRTSSTPGHDARMNLHFPPPYLCTDNATMIAWASMSRFASGDTDDWGVGVRARWGVDELGV